MKRTCYYSLMGEMIAHKAVLVYPEFKDRNTFWSFYRTMQRYVPRGEFGLPKRSHPPLGLMGLYNHLKPYYEELVLIDRNVDPRPLEDHIADADHVYMGGMIVQKESMLKDAKIVKDLKKVLIVGGVIVSEDSPFMELADHLVENESEMVINDLLEGLRDGSAEKYYKGTHTSPEHFFQPDFSSINLDNYVSMTLQISRGCPEDCEFCDITARFGRKPRYTPWEKTEASFRQLYELDWRKPIFIVDDNFIGNPHRAIEVLKNIYQLEEGLGYHFPKYTELSMRLSNESGVMKELRDWFRKTNFTTQFIGVETNNISSLKEAGKSANLLGERTLQEKLEFISKETGGGVMMGMIHGFDNDTAESAESLAEFINSTHSPVVMVGLLNALPYTSLWDRLKREGRLREDSVGTNSDINFIPYNMSVKEAEIQFVKIVGAVYNSKAYFSRALRELELVDPVVVSDTRSNWESAYAVMKNLTHKNALTFWKYLPKAHSIAKRRFGLYTSKYWYLIGEYFTQCSMYTHFKGLTDFFKKQQKKRSYESWQLYSWKELQESPIESIDVVEQYVDEPEAALTEKVRMKLRNGYEFLGTRREALAHFIEPYLNEGLKELKSLRMPSFENFQDVEVKAYFKAHIKMPQILGNVDFAKLEENLRNNLRNKIAYLNRMRHLLKNIRTMKTVYDQQ